MGSRAPDRLLPAGVEATGAKGGVLLPVTALPVDVSVGEEAILGVDVAVVARLLGSLAPPDEAMKVRTGSEGGGREGRLGVNGDGGGRVDEWVDWSRNVGSWRSDRWGIRREGGLDVSGEGDEESAVGYVEIRGGWREGKVP